MKDKLAQYVNFRWDTLPYRPEMLQLIEQARQQERRTVLATASPLQWARGIADYLGLFDEVIGTQNGVNLSGKNKAQELIRLYGEKKFDYAGDTSTDLHVWKMASGAIVVSKSKPLLSRAKAVNPNIIKSISKENAGVFTYLRALRIHQWLKNLLIFVPVLAAHQVDNLDNLENTLIAFLAFSSCASAVYVINDLLDLESDRLHIRKRKRPFAAGIIPIKNGALMIPLLLAISVGLSLILPSRFLLVLVLYFVITLAYSIELKRQAIVDVMILAGLYTMRIIAGAVATDITPSFWLLAFSMFIFLSLALVKRYSELLITLQQKKEEAPGRGYVVSDLPVLMALGVSSSMIAVLVFAFYLNMPEINALYHAKKWLWLISPVLLYWLSRIWMKAHRGEVDDDPIVFAVKDLQSLIIFAICACFFTAAVFA